MDFGPGQVTQQIDGDILWDHRMLVFIHFLEPGTIMTKEQYFSSLAKLQLILRTKRPEYTQRTSSCITITTACYTNDCSEDWRTGM
ncbi:hypothetical protein AVEN_137763-1 [Araneus ventricosus]|uniref:Uncharacterized protein n=1 Tax=Araneus ventricosus TaxID=182803 RepID=A0A4Y2V3I0_ARAVE|nr:hypothetical protein AVEN_137763-1 [Araneus ventricosus]